MGLGLIAGGFVKGYTQGEELKNERAKREALELETKEKRDKALRDTQSRAALQGIPIPGQTMIQGRDYDPTADIDARVMAATPPPHQRAGLLGALGKHFDRDAAAVGSGVKPPAALPVDPATAGVPLPAAPGAASPQPQSAADPGATTVAEVNVQPQAPQPRLATEEDAAKYRWMAARRIGDVEGERAAAKEFFDLRIGSAKKALTFADDDDLGNTLSDVTGRFVTVDRGDDGKYTVKADGKVVGTFANRQEFLGTAFAMLDRSPEAGLEIAMKARQEQRLSQLANAQMAGISERIRASRTQSAIALSQEGRAQTTFSEGQEDRRAVDAAVQFMSNPNNAILYPEQWEAASTTLSRFMPDAAKGYTRSTDAMGNQTTAPVNVFSSFGQTHRASYETNPWVQAGYIAVAPDQNGVPRFWVRGKGKGERIPAASLSEAERRARSIYGRAPGSGAN